MIINNLHNYALKCLIKTKTDQILHKKQLKNQDKLCITKLITGLMNLLRLKICCIKMQKSER